MDSREDFAGAAGFSGSHDETIDLVEAGSYEAGALVAAGADDYVETEEIAR